ncbi:hypothetical protein PMAYCL1PPCAC_00926, partial [Pristionchus mayeri]
CNSKNSYFSRIIESRMRTGPTIRSRCPSGRCQCCSWIGSRCLNHLPSLVIWPINSESPRATRSS